MMPVLQCRELTKRYSTVTALEGVNLSLERGRIVGLLGPNGSGKTTLIKIASGLLTATDGDLFVDGQKPGVETKKRVSYLPEKNYFENWMKVDDVMGLFSDFYADFDKVKAMEMLSRLNIGTRDKIRSMSKGTKEKMQLVLVMSRSADLYLLDEPIGGVDPATRDYILETIIGNYRENSTVLISTHLIMDVEKILDDILFLSNGRIILDAPADDVREDKGKSIDEVFREVFRC